MVDRRHILQVLLESFGVPVYFQPKQNITMTYPCIVYERDDSFVAHANNSLYFRKKRYQVTAIDRNPDSALPDKIEALPLTRLTRTYMTEGLYHYSFSLFF